MNNDIVDTLTKVIVSVGAGILLHRILANMKKQ